MLKKLFLNASKSARAKRGEALRSLINVGKDWKILDLGGGRGHHIHQIFPDHKNITICDYSEPHLATARELYGYETILADGSDTLPFEDGHFDLVFCSSVIEHVTGPKQEAIATTSGPDFKRNALIYQGVFADEIRRVAKRYYVQTPHRYFPIESHSWLPLPVPLLPRPLMIKVLKVSGKVWIKRTDPDWNLLVPAQMQRLFPDAKIVIEKRAGFPKSIMAIKG